MRHLRNSTAFGALAAFLSLSASAQASDIFTPEGTYQQHDASAPARVNWTGFYLGGHVGYGIGTLSSDGSPVGLSFESPIISATAGFDFARDRFVFGPFAEYTYITADEAEDIDDWAVGVRAGIVVAPRTLLYGSAAYARLGDGGDGVDGLRAGLGTEFAVSDNIFVDTKVNYTWYDLEDANSLLDAGDLRALVGLKIKLNSGIGN